jgi:hypothetical protein
MANELDMEAYHSEGIDPGEHKVFNITPSVHSFNERFQGEPPVMPGMESYDPDKMPDWWVKTITPNTKWPGYPGPNHMSYDPEPMPGSFETITPVEPSARLQPMSMKDEPPGGKHGPFDLPLEGGTTGSRMGETTTREPLFKSEGKETTHTKEEMENYIQEYVKSGLRGGKRDQTPIESRWPPERVNKFNQIMQQFDRPWKDRETEAAEEFGIAKGTVRYLWDRFGTKYNKAIK